MNEHLVFLGGSVAEWSLLGLLALYRSARVRGDPPPQAWVGAAILGPLVFPLAWYGKVRVRQ